MIDVESIARNAGAQLQPAPGAREIGEIEIDARGQVKIALIDGTAVMMPLAGEVKEDERPRCDVLISGVEVIQYFQRLGALPVPVRAARYLRRRITGSSGEARIVYCEAGR